MQRVAKCINDVCCVVCISLSSLRRMNIMHIFVIDSNTFHIYVIKNSLLTNFNLIAFSSIIRAVNNFCPLYSLVNVFMCVYLYLLNQHKWTKRDWLKLIFTIKSVIAYCAAASFCTHTSFVVLISAYCQQRNFFFSNCVVAIFIKADETNKIATSDRQMPTNTLNEGTLIEQTLYSRTCYFIKPFIFAELIWSPTVWSI